MEASISDPNDPSCEDAYRAAIQGEVETLMKFYMRREPTSSINILGDTIFHVLALNRHSKVVIQLLNLSMPHNGLKTKNFNGNTALHEAARVGALEIAELMVQKEGSLVHDINSMGETPLYFAVAWGQTKMFRFLKMKTSTDDPGLRRNDGCTILHAAVMGEFYGIALEILGRYPDLAFARYKDEITALHLLVQSPSSFRSRTFYSNINIAQSPFIPLALFRLVIYFCIPSDPCHETEYQQSSQQENRKPGVIRQLFRWFPCLRSIDDEKQKHKLALELVTLLIKRESVGIKNDYYLGHGGQPFQELNIGPSGNTNTINDILMLAARHGIVEVVDIILKECLWVIEFVDENGKNILHLAAEFRKIGVFNLIKSKGYLMTKMVANVDKKGNTALHLAALCVDRYNTYISANKMIAEALWFKKVNDVSPVHQSHFRNSDGKTPKEVFDDTHRRLIEDSVKCIKDAVNGSMLVSTILATMNYSAAFAVPGGYQQDTGLPIFGNTTYLLLFYQYSTTALYSSLINLGICTSWHLCRFDMDHFYLYLPLSTLFLSFTVFFSITYSTAAFAQALILVTNVELITLGWCVGLFTSSVAIIVCTLVYVDSAFPYFHYLVRLFFD